MTTISVPDHDATFNTLLLTAPKALRVALFASGSGGNPERHLPLITSLQEQGCTVIAPYFARLTSPHPHADDLLLRARRLRLALDTIAPSTLPVVGIGHSIGATLLLAFAGGQMWTREGQPLPIPVDKRLERLVLLTPPTNFFCAPHALDNVRIPIQVWAGTDDNVTPPAQAEFLKQTLQDKVPVDLRMVQGAGHFSFMNTLPPQVTDTLIHREVFLSKLAVEIRAFLET